MKLIPLTQGQFAKVDDEDYLEQSQYKWSALWSDALQGYYAARHDNNHPTRKIILMHRAIMKTPDGLVCDHGDHDTLNNQRSNLANCTTSQNGMNQNRAHRNSKTGILGVTPVGNSFKATIGEPGTGRRVSIGIYPTKELAAAARSNAEKVYFGEFSSAARAMKSE